MAKLTVAGIGPGNHDAMTIAVDKALQTADVIIGYSVYIDLVRDFYPGKEFYSTPMTKEVDRCRMALELADQGRDVVMVCSGDSGIYGMAGLIYELRGDAETPEIEILPGITAACSGAALLGAPLTHDFAVVSLSDRLTSWETIAARLENAAKADYSIVIYNPSSKGRPDHLAKACDILLTVLPAGRPCGIAHSIGRAGESVTVLSLGELRETQTDMFSTVFIGNSMTKIIGGKLVTPRGYHYD